jgi:tetratricopeptide (TPR) repeat protein
MHRLNIDLAEASGTDPPEVMLSLINLAGILGSEGRAEEALPLAERALAVTEKVYEEPHPYFSAVALQTLGQSYLQVGELEKARSLLERSLEVTEAGFGSRHQQSAFFRWRLARFYIELGETAKAEPLLLESLDVWEETLGEAELAFRYAEYHALHGETRVALDHLERAVSLGLPLDYRNALPRDPALESLRGDPAFEAIVARVSD